MIGDLQILSRLRRGWSSSLVAQTRLRGRSPTAQNTAHLEREDLLSQNNRCLCQRDLHSAYAGAFLKHQNQGTASAQKKKLTQSLEQTSELSVVGSHAN